MVRNISLPMLNVLFFSKITDYLFHLFFIHLGCSLSLLFKIIFSSFFFFYDKCEHPHFLVQLKKKLSQSPIIEVVAAAQLFFLRRIRRYRMQQSVYHFTYHKLLCH